MLGLLEKEDGIIGMPFKEVRSGEIDTPTLTRLQRVLETGESYKETEVRTSRSMKPGVAEEYMNVVFECLRGKDGEADSVMIVTSDVTEQVITRMEVKRMEEKMRVTVNAAGFGSWHIDSISKELKYNETLAEIFGYVGETQMTYEQVIEQVTSEYLPVIESELERALTSDGNYDVTFTQKRFDDSRLIWVRSLGKVVQDGLGEQKIFSGVVMDVTELKKDEQRKNDFIGMVSHELKTPLTSLTGYIQLLQKITASNTDNFMVTALQRADNQVKKMSTMINGFLNLSRLESGKIQLERIDFELDGLVSEIISEMKITVSNYLITLTPCSPILIHADRDKIASVITNLLSNAVKYSPNNKNIEVVCSLKKGMAEVLVVDHGMGIEAENLPYLFDRFYRVEGTLNNTISGFGIGLYLSAEIIERHGGRIWAESILGEGSAIGFSLPLL
jgi:two-component system sensor histidine kinase VicK